LGSGLIYRYDRCLRLFQMLGQTVGGPDAEPVSQGPRRRFHRLPQVRATGGSGSRGAARRLASLEHGQATLAVPLPHVFDRRRRASQILRNVDLRTSHARPQNQDGVAEHVRIVVREPQLVERIPLSIINSRAAIVASLRTEGKLQPRSLTNSQIQLNFNCGPACAAWRLLYCRSRSRPQLPGDSTGMQSLGA